MKLPIHAIQFEKGRIYSQRDFIFMFLGWKKTTNYEAGYINCLTKKGIQTFYVTRADLFILEV